MRHTGRDIDMNPPETTVWLPTPASTPPGSRLHGRRTERQALERLITEYQDIRASVRRGLHHRQRELAALEAGARQMRHFLPAPHHRSPPDTGIHAGSHGHAG